MHGCVPVVTVLDESELVMTIEDCLKICKKLVCC